MIGSQFWTSPLLSLHKLIHSFTSFTHTQNFLSSGDFPAHQTHMEKSPVLTIRNVNGGQRHHHHQQPMEPYVSNFPPKPPLRNASFSPNLVEPNINHSHSRISNQADDSEISIFDAQKYYCFNDTSTTVDSSKAVISNSRVSPVNVNVLDNTSTINGSLEPTSERQHRNGDVSSVALPARFSSSSSLDGYGRNYRARSFNATPTASSEASWNSQTGLLSNPPGAISVSMKHHRDTQRGGSSPAPTPATTTSKWQLFGRKCPCSGKKSVQVDEEKVNKTPPPPQQILQQRSPENEIPVPEKIYQPSEEIVSRTRRISTESRFSGLGQRVNIAPVRLSYNGATDAAAGFTFPILNQTSSVKLVLNNIPAINRMAAEEPRRESLEIFQPTTRATSEEDENRVSRQSFTFPASPPGRTRIITDDDVASDASSDLFEIESFSTQTTATTMYPMYNNYRRDSLDEAASFNVARRLAVANGNNILYCPRRSLDEPATPSVAATELYEPSEASIDWSVTTAEGFDRGSVITNYSVAPSDFGDMAAMRSQVEKSKKKGNGGGSGGGSLLMSCRCEKAVSVVGPVPSSNGTRHVSGGTCNVSSYRIKQPPVGIGRSQSHTPSLPFAT